MPEDKQGASASARSGVDRLFFGLIGVLVFVGMWYIVVGAVGRIGFLEGYAGGIRAVQVGGAIILGAFFLLGLVLQTLDVWKAAQARRAAQQVAEALDRARDTTPVAEISSGAIAASLAGTKVSSDQIARLVEQRKQQLLIDDEYFREELRTLIVAYLQPLPRNAKRFLNRFRVNLLIAHSRGLLSSEPRVGAQQIGKWLILVERWPILSRSLSAAPEWMRFLETQSAQPAPVPGPDPKVPPPDPFMESINLLAPVYHGDEDLREFVRSAPVLAPVLFRLVHYGDGETVASAAA